MNNKVYVKDFYICGLHGDQDVLLSFDAPYKIIVAENGAGKTTVLNLLFYFLTSQYQKLSRIDFEKLILISGDNQSIELQKEDLLQEQEIIEKLQIYSILKRRIGEQSAKSLINATLNLDSSVSIRDTSEFRRLQSEFPRHSSELYQMLDQVRKDPQSQGVFSVIEKRQKIKELFPLDVFYLPTYRRVEEDLQSLGYEEDLLTSKENLAHFTIGDASSRFVKIPSGKEQLIHFGMRDVNSRFAKITKEIKDSAVTWYSKVSGRMLDELMSGLSVNNSKRERIKQPEALGIVLDRIGQNISQDRKSEILDLVQSDNIYNDQYNTLAYFLSNLIEIYDQQREKDNKIKEFVKVAGKYLVNKEINYDESNVKISVINIRTKKEVELENLSSGEKQLISILSKLYLESNEPCVIIFDEPELSLSIEWQRDLLPDIISSNQCKFLLAATHSPFIFENELDKYAEALSITYREVVYE